MKLKSHLYTFFLPITFLLINLVIKLRYVTYPSLAKDEPFSVYISQFNIGTIIEKLSQGNNPPLYELFLHFWTSFFGISEFTVRFPSVVFSSLTVYFIFRLCHKFFTLQTAVLAALLFTFSNYQMYFAHEARAYSLFMLLTTVSMYLYLKLLTDNVTKVRVVLFVIVNILLLYSHFFSWFVLMIQIYGVLFVHRKEREKSLQFLKYFGLILLFYIPYVWTFLLRFIDSFGGTWIEPVTNLRPLHTFLGLLINDTHVGYTFILLVLYLVVQKYLNTIFNSLLLRRFLMVLCACLIMISLSIRLPLFEFGNDFSSPIVMIIFLSFFLFLFVHFQSQQKHSIQAKIISAWLFLPLFIMFIASFSIPMFIERYLIYFTPAFYIILAIGIFKLGKEFAFGITVMLVALMLANYKMVSNNERDVKSMVNLVIEHKRDSKSGVFICPDYMGPTFSYYYDQSFFSVNQGELPFVQLKNKLQAEDIYLVKSKAQVDSIQKRNDFEKIIYVDAAADFSYSNNGIKYFLDDQFLKSSVHSDSNFIPSIFNIYTYELK